MKTFKVTVDGQPFTVEVEEVKSTGVANNSPAPVAAAATPAAAPAQPAAARPAAEQKPAQENSQPAASGTGATIKAPMPGSVLDVAVREGDAVKKDDVLLVLEAMKMENELTAPESGTIAKVLVKKGDTVNSGDPLIIMS